MWSSALLALCGLAIHTSIVNAGFYTTKADQNCVYACDQALTYVHFADEKKDATNSFVPKCSSHLRAQSLFYCTAIHCSQQEIVAGLDAQNESCWQEAGMRYPSYASVMSELPAVGDDAGANITMFDKKAKKTAKKLTVVAIPSPKLYDEFLATVTLYYNNMNLSLDLGYSLYGFWALAVLIGLSYRIACHFVASQPLGRTVQRDLLIPALLHHQHQEKFKPFGSLPTRLESAVIGLYFVMLFIFMFPGYHLLEPNLWWPEDSVQLCRQIADRAAHLAIANLPILIFFGTRNNPLLWLTGWSYSAFNAFHRWVARMVLLILIVHAVCQTLAATYSGPGEYAADLAKVYFQFGIAAITIYGTLIGTSSTLRRRFYDAWLVTHIILATGLLATVFYHVKIWHGHFNGFIWAGVAMWSLDRVLRLGRILWNSKGIKKANLTFDDASGIVRMDVTNHIRGKTAPGHSYYYVYVPSLLGWQNHPFSLCTWKTSDSESMRQTFLVRPQSGFTRRLVKRLSSHKSDTESSIEHSASLNVLLEGPYGIQHDLSKHSHVTMIAGGSGIAAMVSYVQSLLRHEGAATTIHLIWAVRELQFAEDVLHAELGALVGHDRLQLDVHVTGQSTSPTTPPEEEKTKAGQLTTEKSTGLQHGRPDVANLLTLDHRATTRDIGVLCCGPPKMADQVRRTVVQLLRAPGPSIAYYNESFGW